jgi:hypothetical protein
LVISLNISGGSSAFARAQFFGKMPSDGLTFAVGVGRDEDLGGLFAAAFNSVMTFLRLAMTSPTARTSSMATPSLLLGRSRTAHRGHDLGSCRDIC